MSLRTSIWSRACLHQSTKHIWNHDTLCQRLTLQRKIWSGFDSAEQGHKPRDSYYLVWWAASFTEPLCLVSHRDPCGARGVVWRVSWSSKSTSKSTSLLFLLLPTEVGGKNNNASEQEKFLFRFVETVIKKTHARWYETNSTTSDKKLCAKSSQQFKNAKSYSSHASTYRINLVSLTTFILSTLCLCL